MQSEANKRATNKYNTKCKIYHVKFYAHEIEYSKVFDDFLSDIGSTPTAFLKKKIIEELKEKGYISE